jgi:ABC-2 type transport system ATP-binding protein
VGLAHALFSDPEILVLDEPTSGLDPNQIVEIRQIIRRIGAEKTIVFSTHILSEAEATCDRLIIIHQGRIAADGATTELKNTARGDSIIHLTLVGANPKEVVAMLRTIEGVNDIETTTDGPALLAKLVCRSAADPRPDVYRAIKQTDWTIMAFFQQVQSLETIFRQLTAEN